MTKRLAPAIAALAVLALLAWYFLPGRVSRPTAATPGRPNAASTAIPAPKPIVDRKTQIISSAESHSPLADELNSPATDIRHDLRIVTVVLDTFRSNFPHDGNPVGTNAEITAALTGRNRLGLALIPPDHPAINADGELCDRWGTPFFFHALSGTRMEILSAGPDRRPHTADDIVQTP